MNSCLYNCEVIHSRLKPKKHKLTHKVFMFYVDLDEAASLSKEISWIGYNASNVYAFWDKDHLQIGGKTARENILLYLRENGFNESIGRITLLTNLRTFGHIFNPVSFYFCFNEKDEPRCAVVEIGNTFREQKPYFLGPQTLKDSGFDAVQNKFFYISPFTDLDIKMRFQLKIPDGTLDLRVQDIQDNDKFLYASLTGEKVVLNKSNLFWYTLKFPWITLKVIGLIHLHAFFLWLKRVPHHNKEDNPDQQKGVLRVHKGTAQAYEKSTR